MLDLGIFRPSSSPLVLPLHMVLKVQEGAWRPWRDYRRLNAETIPDKYPVLILQGVKIFTKLELCKAFYQIPVAAEDIHKTAITTPFGLYEFLRMPFGLRNVAQSFQRLIGKALHGLSYLFANMDDHVRHVTQVFQHLEHFSLKTNQDKVCLPFLNWISSDMKLTVLASHLSWRKLQLYEFPQITTLQQLQHYLGLINYYRQFIPHSGTSYQLTLWPGNKKRKDNSVGWSSCCFYQFKKCTSKFY